MPQDRFCEACGKEVKGPCLEVPGMGTYHPTCFRCTKCSAAIDGEFGELGDGSLVCEKCMPEEEGGPKECAACKQAIAGQFAIFDDKNYHPGCFVCQCCDQPLSGAVFKKEGKLICQDCHASGASLQAPEAAKKPQAESEKPAAAVAFKPEAARKEEEAAGAKDKKLQGFLYKKSPAKLRLRGWDWRYFTLKEHQLAWWHKREASKLQDGVAGSKCKGCIDLRDGVEITLDARKATRFHVMPTGGPYANRIFEFDASQSQHDRETWIAAIHAQAAEEQQPAMGRHTSVAFDRDAAEELFDKLSSFGQADSVKNSETPDAKANPPLASATAASPAPAPVAAAPPAAPTAPAAAPAAPKPAASPKTQASPAVENIAATRAPVGAVAKAAAGYQAAAAAATPAKPAAATPQAPMAAAPSEKPVAKPAEIIPVSEAAGADEGAEQLVIAPIPKHASDHIVAKIEAAMQKKEAAGQNRIKAMKAENDILLHVGKMRDFLQNSMVDREDRDRKKLLDIFGGDCQRVAHLHAVLEAITLSDMHKNDRRIVECRRACETVESVVIQKGLKAKLAEAIKQQKSPLRPWEGKKGNGAAAEDSAPATAPVAGSAAAMASQDRPGVVPSVALVGGSALAFQMSGAQGTAEVSLAAGQSANVLGKVRPGAAPSMGLVGGSALAFQLSGAQETAEWSLAAGQSAGLPGKVTAAGAAVTQGAKQQQEENEQKTLEEQEKQKDLEQKAQLDKDRWLLQTAEEEEFSEEEETTMHEIAVVATGGLQPDFDFGPKKGTFEMTLSGLVLELVTTVTPEFPEVAGVQPLESAKVLSVTLPDLESVQFDPSVPFPEEGMIKAATSVREHIVDVPGYCECSAKVTCRSPWGSTKLKDSTGVTELHYWAEVSGKLKATQGENGTSIEAHVTVRVRCQLSGAGSAAFQADGKPRDPPKRGAKV
eukprot:TRINITY_DN31524_c0_g2_i1.p1 TRINITY_DN31524_c0_g2~~TRINITY_DN31524_c0_g2_i1.p1  ORF type:complete len:939 (-),score=298.66 TRINITY_DN31524_c0_g2_i1:344-3160(-)